MRKSMGGRILREMPADFRDHVGKKNAELRKRYKTSDGTLERWRGELDLYDDSNAGGKHDMRSDRVRTSHNRRGKKEN